jgi:hypothetical protein
MGVGMSAGDKGVAVKLILEAYDKHPDNQSMVKKIGKSLRHRLDPQGTTTMEYIRQLLDRGHGAVNPHTLKSIFLLIKNQIDFEPRITPAKQQAFRDLLKLDPQLALEAGLDSVFLKYLGVPIPASSAPSLPPKTPMMGALPSGLPPILSSGDLSARQQFVKKAFEQLCDIKAGDSQTVKATKDFLSGSEPISLSSFLDKDEIKADGKKYSPDLSQFVMDDKGRVFEAASVENLRKRNQPHPLDRTRITDETFSPLEVDSRTLQTGIGLRQAYAHELRRLPHHKGSYTSPLE